MPDLFPGTIPPPEPPKFKPSLTCLSIRQPWAWLIVHGYKPVENRSWRYAPTFRGPLLIHASLTVDKEHYQFCERLAGVEIPLPSEIETGGIVGRVDMIGVVTESRSPWFSGPLGFTFENAKPLPFVPVRGKLGFFMLDETDTFAFEETMRITILKTARSPD